MSQSITISQSEQTLTSVLIYSGRNDKSPADGLTGVQAAVLSAADRGDAENKQRFHSLAS